ncbi:MAG: CBS domain-containing protein [Candidatus Woesearchaeota archaeon]
MEREKEHKKSSNYPENSAGTRMITNVPKVKIWEIIGSVEKLLKNNISLYETIDYVYAIDDNNVLRGVFSIKELFRVKNKNEKVAGIMNTKLITATPKTPQERIVYLALSNKVKSIPIVDEKQRLLGVIPNDVILDIFNKEVREDVFKFGGIVHKVDKKFTPTMAPPWLMIKLRFPWLIVGILGGTIAASIVGTFESVLNKYIVLAAFMPVMVYMTMLQELSQRH